jgi:transposase
VLHGADEGDTAALLPTISQATENLRAVVDDGRVADKVHDDWATEAVTDKGYHSNGTMQDLKAAGVRSYVSEPDRSHLGERDWAGKPEAQRAVYANRRRVRGDRGRRLMRRRGEFIERSFAHCYETGGMRRVHLRGRDNVLKRLLVHVGGFNLSLVMRKLCGKGTPRGLQGLLSRLPRHGSGVWVVVTSVLHSFANAEASDRTSDLAPTAA